MVTIYNLKSNFQVILLFEADSPLKEEIFTGRKLCEFRGFC